VATKKLTEAQRKRVCEDYSAGVSTLKLARKTGYSPQGILMVLRKAGVPIRGRGHAEITEARVRPLKAEIRRLKRMIQEMHSVQYWDDEQRAAREEIKRLRQDASRYLALKSRIPQIHVPIEPGTMGVVKVQELDKWLDR
jgi:hypothetical protein